MARKLLAFLLAMAGPSLAFADDEPTIHWLIWEQSPEYVKQGDYAGQGYADKALKFFMDHLPDHDHNVVWASVRRWEREILLPNRCSPYLWNHFHTDRLAYSKPYTLSTPHAVIFHRKYQERFGPPGTVLSLRKLLDLPDLTLMTMPIYIDETDQEPRYPVLHPYLAPHRGTERLKELDHGTNEVDLRLIERLRADYALGYPTTVIAQQRDRGVGDKFVTYGLKEHQEYRTIHVACFGDAFGRNLVERIDGLLSREALKGFLEFQEEWNGGDPAFREAFGEKLLRD